MGTEKVDDLDAFIERLWYDTAHDFALFSSAVREHLAVGGDTGFMDEVVRRGERKRLADLLDENAGTIAAFASDNESTVRVIALMLRLDGSR